MFGTKLETSVYSKECDQLRNFFKALEYPEQLINLTVKDFIASKVSSNDQGSSNINNIGEFFYNHYLNRPPFQRSEISRFNEKTGNRIGVKLQPVYRSNKIVDALRVCEEKPIVNQQCVVYYFQCGLCDADFVSFTIRHLFQRIEDHRLPTVGQHIKQHNVNSADTVYSVLPVY